MDEPASRELLRRVAMLAVYVVGTSDTIKPAVAEWWPHDMVPAMALGSRALVPVTVVLPEVMVKVVE